MIGMRNLNKNQQQISINRMNVHDRIELWQEQAKKRGATQRWLRLHHLLSENNRRMIKEIEAKQ